MHNTVGVFSKYMCLPGQAGTAAHIL